ncbi:MAG TPA: VWA domain-containing protein [Candidatus Limnocylindrales bacterium]|nr:VWA domain-containing protein [Candidatus Limnocylindrales bacterium]
MTLRLFDTDVTFEAPWAFALLAVALIALVLEVRRERVRPGGVLFSSLGLLPASRASWRVRARWLLFPIRLLGVTALITALAAPAVVEASYDVPAEGIDIVIALDTSSSMTARDFGGQTRIDVSKNVIVDFLQGLKNDRAGVVIFSAEAMVLSPLTLDYKAAQRLIQPVEAGKILRDGTAIGTGLATALNAVRGSTARSKVVVLLTDGQSNTGDISPLDAAQLAKVLGIRVYTIGAVPGVRTTIDVDETLMRRMSEMSGGQYYRVSDETALRNVYREIEALEKARVGSRGFIETHDATLPFIAAGAALLVLELVLGTTLLRRTP